MQEKNYNYIDAVVERLKNGKYTDASNPYGFKAKDINMYSIEQSIQKRLDEVNYIDSCKQVNPEVLAGFCCTL